LKQADFSQLLTRVIEVSKVIGGLRVWAEEQKYK
jgi:hypothetical protein